MTETERTLARMDPADLERCKLLCEAKLFNHAIAFAFVCGEHQASRQLSDILTEKKPDANPE